MTPILDQIQKPEDLQALPLDQLEALALEIRQELIDVVSAKGGHIGPNLGVIELTLALLRTFTPPKDKMIFDVGHQGYVYKMLTGRRQLLRETLRDDEGCCGFMSREESIYDPFGAGHAGTAISAALGMAKARDLCGDDEKVIAIVGDGSIGCGISFEALNQVSETTRDFIVILNDNEMSISGNVGALANYLKHHPLSPSGGTRQRSAKRPGDLFRDLGFTYLGPVDGHHLPTLLNTLQQATLCSGPVIIHTITEKGRGFEPAKCNPEKFHGLGMFDPVTGKPVGSGRKAVSFSAAFGQSVLNQLKKRDDLITITAGMCLGTGLESVRSEYPNHLVDVGIAEEHAVIFAAGLATKPIRPIVAIYATFMQRAMDCVYHDVCLQNLPVIFCMDRAGVVADGPTHHGIYDLAFWLTLPNLTIMQPATADQLDQMMALALAQNSPVAIRYPKSNCPADALSPEPATLGKAAVVESEGKDGAIWAVGAELATALEIRKQLAEQGIILKVVDTRFLAPFDETLFADHLSAGPVITLEDHTVDGGFGALTDRVARKLGLDGKLLHYGWPKEVISWGTVSGLRRKYGLTAEQLAVSIALELRKCANA